MNTKRVLLLNYEYPPLGGGAGNATRFLLREFAGRRDLEVIVITSSHGPARIEHPADNVTIHFLDIGKRGSLHYQTYRDLLVYSFRALLRARRVVHSWRPTVIHAFFGVPCGFIAMLLRVPYIVSLRGSDVPGYSPRMERMERLVLTRLSRRIWKRASAVVVNSRGLGALARRTAFHDFPVIPNGVDTRLFSPHDEADRQRDPEVPLRIIAVGRLITRKGFHMVVEAVREEELVLVGDGPERKRLEFLARGRNAMFLGEQTQEQVAVLLRDADVFVLPSANEGMSNSLLEAMACGLPVIVSNVGGTSELVRGNGLVLKDLGTGSIRNALDRLSADPAARIRWGKRSREIALEYSWSAAAAAYEELYRSVHECAR